MKNKLWKTSNFFVGRFLALITIFFYIFSLFWLSVQADDVFQSEAVKNFFWEEKGVQILDKIHILVQKVSQHEKWLYFLEKTLAEKSIVLQRKENMTDQEEGTNVILLSLISELNKKRSEGHLSQNSSTWSGFSSQEKINIENKIIWLQRSIFTFVEKYQSERGTGIEFKGKFHAEARIDEEFLWNFLAKVQMNDIFGKMKWADSDISWKLAFELTNSPSASSLATNIQVITQGGEQFVKVSPLEKTWTWNEVFETLKAGLNTLAEKWTFTKTSSNSWNETQKIVQGIQNLLPLYLARIKEEALFTPYKKIGNNIVLLAPSKALCSLVKNSESGSWEDCSDSEYSFMSQEYQDMGIHIELESQWDKDRYTIFGWNDSSQAFWRIEIQNSQIQIFELSIIPNQNVYPKEWFSLDYDNNRLDIKFRTSDINFWARIHWDEKQFSWKYALSMPWGWILQWTIKWGWDDNNNRIEIMLDAKNFPWESENISGKIHMQRIDTKHLIFRIEWSYTKNQKEVFGGNILYDIVVEPKEVEVVAPKDWIDINDINGSWE